MNMCDKEGDTACSSESDDESDGAVEGKWLGVSVAAFFFLMFVIWFIRTLASRPRRLQLIYNFHHCCKLKAPEDGHTEYQAPNRETSAEPASNGDSSNGVIYYTPTLPSSYKNTVSGSGQLWSPVGSDGRFGHYHIENEHNGACNGSYGEADLAVATRLSSNRPRYVRGMRKSRSSISMQLSGSLAPIQEVEDATDTDAIQRVRVRVMDATRQGQLNSSPLGSRSHPERLASLASDSEEENDDGENESANREQNGKDASTGRRVLEIKNGPVNVNFIHGSDDDECIE